MNNSAIATINGNEANPKLRGQACFCDTTNNGVIVTIEIFGLPDDMLSNFFGMHIHEFGDCSLPFDKTGSHYNPNKTLHPLHLGDLPPLLSNDGYAWMSFFDRRFTVSEIIGKSLVIHSMRDDFTTQPAGGSGIKIGCGAIERANAF